MNDFYHRRLNVLVCTTIIETGLDIPNANTIIIERADKFGLAQLHQLRGRVGRSHRQAYAYLLTPEPRSLTTDAVKRLDLLRLVQKFFNFTVAELAVLAASPRIDSAVSRCQAVDFAGRHRRHGRQPHDLRGRGPAFSVSEAQAAVEAIAKSKAHNTSFGYDCHCQRRINSRCSWDKNQNSDQSQANQISCGKVCSGQSR